jgi:S-DNA-T family DNA segregation ATPase FtsK/SpoIIIE
LLDARRNELISTRRSGGDSSAAFASWKQIIFAFDKFSEASDDNDYYQFMKLIFRIIRKEHGMKVTVLALDTLDDFRGDYSDAGKALRNEQNGLLLGSIRDQTLFDASLPHSVPEKEFTFGDGYIIKKNRFSGIRSAM